MFFLISFYFILILSFSVQHSGSSHGVESALLINVELSKSIKVIIKKNLNDPKPLNSSNVCQKNSSNWH